MKKAFTLIELLVVVLIIGILAAIALPQYKIAVVKSRLAAVIPAMSAIKTGLESYYLANGEYPQTLYPDVSSFDISTSCQVFDNDSSVIKCDNYFLIDTSWTGVYGVRACYCPGYQNTWVNCNSNQDFCYSIYADHNSTNPGKRICSSKTDFGTKVCKSLNNY